MRIIDWSSDVCSSDLPPQSARLYLDGINTVIERDTNEIDDLIDDVTLDLYKAEAGTTITLEIENDLSAARTQIDGFVTAYNDVKSFLLSQQTVSEDGEIDASAILFGDHLLRSLGRDHRKSGRAACRGRVGQYV